MPLEEPTVPESSPPTLSLLGQWLVLIAAFLGWFFAGGIMSTTSIEKRSASIDLHPRSGAIDREQFHAFNQRIQEARKTSSGSVPLSSTDQQTLDSWNALALRWFAFFQCAFLLGAATGGWLFGALGDRIGRASALGFSILCYSGFAGLGPFAETPTQLLILWYLACLGVGGVWPNAVALLAETWSGLSRPLVAGILGTSANIGIFLMATLARRITVDDDNWRWMLQVDALPFLLGLFTLLAVPESPRWRQLRESGMESTGGPASVPLGDVFRSPYLSITLIGILLATVPVLGGWGVATWMVPWAEQEGQKANPPDRTLNARVNQARAVTGMVGSLLGGWIAHALGRRRSYFLISLCALFCAQYTYGFLKPTDATFMMWVSALGFFSGIYFGWLPLFLPELFPTAIRSTGAGVSFNFSRILTAGLVLTTGILTVYIGSNYPAIGMVTGLIYAVGAVVIWFAPDKSKRTLQ